MLLAPLIITTSLTGCPPGECVGAGCQDVYSAAMVSVYHGAPEGLGTRLDPAEDAWLSMTGSEALGPDWAVALAGNVLVLGAPELGAVLIFLLEGRDAGSLGGQALVIPDLVSELEGSRLGAALLTVDIDGDEQRELLVAAPKAPGVGDAPSAGRLHQFELNGYFSPPLWDSGGEVQLSDDDATITALGAGAYDQAGSVLEACGDLDGDGVPELAVTAPWDERSGAALSGAVTVISSAALAEARTQDLSAVALDELGATYSFSQLGGSAGAALHCGTSLDADALPEIIVGAPYADSDDHDAAGAVFIISGTRAQEDLLATAEATLDEAASAVIYGPTDEAYLGSSMAMGDVGGDGEPDLLVGAPGAGRRRGLALLYADVEPDRDDPEAILRFVGESAGDRFGTSVALPDINGDRLADIVVGAPRHNPTGDEEHFAAGAAYAWYGETFFRAWDQTSHADKADTTIVRQQAWLLTGERITTGDLDGDGYDELVLVHRIQPDF